MPESKPRNVRKRYTNQFKKQIVELCLAGHKCKRDIADEYDLPESILYEWIKRYKQYGTFDQPSIRATKETDVDRLKRRIKHLELENKILKDVALMLKTSPEQSSEQ